MPGQWMSTRSTYPGYEREREVEREVEREIEREISREGEREIEREILGKNTGEREKKGAVFKGRL